MKLLAKLDHLYDECKGNQWLRYFAVFCRVALALGFIPSGIVTLQRHLIYSFDTPVLEVVVTYQA